MASQHLFTLVTQNFNAAVAGGAGVVTQWTYTVPNGKRAIVASLFAWAHDNGNAVDTVVADILINAVRAIASANDGAGNNSVDSPKYGYPRTNINEGDTVSGRTANTGAAAVTMQVAAIIEEYG